MTTDPYQIYAALLLIWAFDPGPNTLYFAMRAQQEGTGPTMMVALGTALFNAFIMFLTLFGLTGLGDMPLFAHTLKAFIAAFVIWLMFINLATIHNIREAAKAKVFRQPIKISLSPRQLIGRLVSGIAWGAMNPVNIILFALFVPGIESSAVEPAVLGKYTLTLFVINILALGLIINCQQAVRSLYRIAWIQLPLHLAIRLSFIGFAGWTIYLSVRTALQLM